LKKPIQFNEIRNVEKKIIWKLAIDEVEKNNPLGRAVDRQILLYYRFGSSLYKKKTNYTLSMKTETIFNLFLSENFPDSFFSLA
jgi:hypothetical protein